MCSHIWYIIMFILIMMLSIGEPKDSVYLGAIKYTLQAN